MPQLKDGDAMTPATGSENTHWQGPTPFEATKRMIGGFVLLFGVCLLAPLPLSNIPISLTIVLVAFAYLVEDGILLAVALTITLGLLAAVAATLWSTVAELVWLIRG
jgi:hypothetical protein